jgi:hypothetical protein
MYKYKYWSKYGPMELGGVREFQTFLAPSYYLKVINETGATVRVTIKYTNTNNEDKSTDTGHITTGTTKFTDFPTDISKDIVLIVQELRWWPPEVWSDVERFRYDTPSDVCLKVTGQLYSMKAERVTC